VSPVFAATAAAAPPIEVHLFERAWTRRHDISVQHGVAALLLLLVLLLLLGRRGPAVTSICPDAGAGPFAARLLARFY